MAVSRRPSFSRQDGLVAPSLITPSWHADRQEATVNSIVLQLADEAMDSFIGYLSGYVVALEAEPGVAGSPAVVVVDGIRRTDDGLIALGVRAYDENRLEATGAPRIIDFELITAITVF